MSEAYYGEIRLLPYDFTPKGWLPCDGSILQIQANSALFALIGTQYGGDGKKTFALPDLRGRVLQGATGVGDIGETGGVEQVTLMPMQMPSHMHNVQATTAAGTGNAVANSIFATATDALNPAPAVYGPVTTTVTIASDSILPAGGNLPHENRQPYLALNYCIAVQGIYPSRS